jgi:SAM-dependent methyltransferase
VSDPHGRLDDPSALPEALRSLFAPLGRDEALERDLERAQGHGAIREAARRVLRRAVSDFDADGILRTHHMALLGPSHWAELGRGPRLLDVGAGSGAITEHARAALRSAQPGDDAPEANRVFREIVTTETSAPRCRRLRARGFVCHRVDLSREPLPDPIPFDTISLLNVLDRCDRPRSLLRGALRSLAPEGRLILSVPLPARPHVDRGRYTEDPDEPLGGSGDTFERALVDLVRSTIEPLGLAIVRLARAPYVSVGRTREALDAAILVCRP